ncbi:GNAT family N-acetyltransferase [Telmatospirillum siberiense]|uniref:Uncharacterized protein n=1 Tax=Telmatospirillum siberiense TaxID=382514 RepID=A0A2N3Q1F0_9PROT|nr:GNAT family N-acetyltransferase [Telmatospirillum siberiense]PKU26477.1 hypothetical protein CWS72_01125 [Telmatospirillum siberiense]
MTLPDFEVRFVDKVDAVPSALWDCCFAPPLEGRWWYESLEAAGLDDQFRFFYAILCRDGREVGLAPLFLMDVPIELVMPPALLPTLRLLGRVFPSLLRQRTLFVGSPCADEGTVGFLPGIDRRAALLCFQDALEARAAALGTSMLVWKDMPSGMDEDFAWLAGRRRLFPLVSFPGTEARLPSPRKEDYFAAMKASRRHLFRKKLRRSAQAVKVSVEVVQAPGGEVLDEIFELFWQTYEKAETKFERLNRRFFELLAERTASHFILLREAEGGDLIAFMLCFAVGGRLINKFIGIDYHRPKEWLLYFRLWEAALDWALPRGFTTIQSGQTGYAPKIEMGHALVPLTNHCRHRHPLMHRLYAAIARTVGWHTLDEDLARFLKAHPDATPGA